MSIEVNFGVAHGAVEHESCGASGRVGELEIYAVGAFTDERQTTRTACFYGLFSFSVLFHGHGLEIVGPVEGTVDSPVVWYAYILPFCVGFTVAFGKLPSVVEGCFRTLGGGGQGQDTRECQSRSFDESIQGHYLRILFLRNSDNIAKRRGACDYVYTPSLL